MQIAGLSVTLQFSVTDLHEAFEMKDRMQDLVSVHA